jgi:hypothetical protein
LTRHASLVPGLISSLKVTITIRLVWTVGSPGAGALSPSTDACGIAGGPSRIAILNKTVVPGGELIAVLAALCW